jgi:UDP-2-acetamido-2,6-beta-L-arabino-hexul-4-ose reductase
VNVVVTGSGGFLGKNLVSWLESLSGITLFTFDKENTAQELDEQLAVADLVYHLAGVNRPQFDAEFQTSNVNLTVQVCEHLLQRGLPTTLVLSSSIQVVHDNPYGVSKRQAEEAVARYSAESGARVLIYRLKNVFGKWCRPNYNSVVATFCHNAAHNLPISISDHNRELELVYVDDVMESFLSDLGTTGQNGVTYREVTPSYTITLGRLAEVIRSFAEMRTTLRLPNLSDEFTRKLYGTYLSYLESDDLVYPLDRKCDPRGCLAEFAKSPAFGQLFVSRTAAGVTRGNHYHHTKCEKFLVVQGEAIVRLRHILGGDVIELHIRGEEFRVVDIPAGYTHSIENVGKGELVTLFWASEVFDPDRSDTHGMKVA